MADRVFNFSAGPATLPLPVLEQVQRDIVTLPGVGASPLEVSHRGAWFEGVITEAEANLRGLLRIPEGYHVMFCQGGATQQFAMAPMNLRRSDRGAAAYVLTGAWGSRAVAEAMRITAAQVAWTGEGDGFVRVPTAEELAAVLHPDAPYVHITSNETIQGVEWQGDGTPPSIPAGVPLVCDTSSDFLARPIDVGAYGLLYAGAQKNAGPAGLTVAIIGEGLLEGIPSGLPTMLDYRTFAEHRSMYNTPPIFAIWVLMLVTRWLRDDVGGLARQAEHNRRKAALVYDAIDRSGGFYRGHAEPGSRSLMNATWRLPAPALERRFVDDAADAGMIELRGHRSVGGIRASLYNAMPLAGAEALAGFMADFAAAHA